MQQCRILWASDPPIVFSEAPLEPRSSWTPRGADLLGWLCLASLQSRGFKGALELDTFGIVTQVVSLPSRRVHAGSHA